MLERLGLEIGKRKRPKGINILALMASILDPRMKGGVGYRMMTKRSSMKKSEKQSSK